MTELVENKERMKRKCKTFARFDLEADGRKESGASQSLRNVVSLSEVYSILRPLDGHRVKVDVAADDVSHSVRLREIKICFVKRCTSSR